MTKREVRNALLLSLATVLRSKSFVLNKSLSEFTRKTDDGWHKIQLVFLERGECWEINLGLLIRKDLVEEIYHQASYFAPKYHKSTPTVGITLDKLINDGKEHHFWLCKDNDIELCEKQIIQIIESVALGFFDQYNSLASLDRAVNTNNEESIFSGLKYEGNVGIILAKLVNNRQYNFLKDRYRIYYKNLSNGFYLPEYEKLVSLLEKICIHDE